MQAVEQQIKSKVSFQLQHLVQLLFQYDAEILFSYSSDLSSAIYRCLSQKQSPKPESTYILPKSLKCARPSGRYTDFYSGFEGQAILKLPVQHISAMWGILTHLEVMNSVITSFLTMLRTEKKWHANILKYSISNTLVLENDNVK